MKKQKVRLPRNPAAAALALPQHRVRVIRDKKKYTRKNKHRDFRRGRGPSRD